MNLQMQTSWRNLIVWAFVDDCFCTSQCCLCLYAHCGKSSSWKNYWIFHPRRRQKVVFVWKIVWRMRDREEVNRMWRKKFWFCSNWIYFHVSVVRTSWNVQKKKSIDLSMSTDSFSWIFLKLFTWSKKIESSKDIHFLSISSLWLLLSSSSPYEIELFISFLRCCCFDIASQTVKIFGENSRSPSVMRNKQLNSSANYSRVENKQHEKVKVSQFRLSQTSHTRASTQSICCEFTSWAKRRTRKSNKNLQKFSTVVERFFSLFCDSICVRWFSLIFHLFGSRWDEGISSIARFFCLNFDFSISSENWSFFRSAERILMDCRVFSSSCLKLRLRRPLLHNWWK